MTDPVCEAHVRAFLVHLRATGRAPREVLVGRDLRPSSPRIAAACRRAVRAEGMTAVGCGVVPTPALALEAARRGAAAVMVTGSHIPFDRNGLKFYRPGRRGDRQGRRGGDPRRAGRAGAGAGRCGPGSIRAWGRATWRGRWSSSAQGVLAGLRVGLYEHSAAGREQMRRALAALGAEVVPLGRSASFVPIDTEAIAARAGGAHPGVGGRAPAGGAGVDGRGRRPAARRGRDRAGAARGRARGAGGAAPRGGRGGGAAERQHGAGALGVVRAGRCARGSARPTSSKGWRGSRRRARGWPSATRRTAGSSSAGPRCRRTGGGWRRCRPATRCCPRWRCSRPWRGRGGRSRSSWATCPPERATASGRLQDVDPGAAARLLDGAGCATRRAAHCCRGSGRAASWRSTRSTACG